MDTSHVDPLLQSLKSAFSRRCVLAGLTGSLVATGIVGSAGDEAIARKKGRRNKNKNRNKRKNKNDKAKVRVDATCTGAGATGVSHKGGDLLVAQTFTAVRSGPLTKVTIPVNNLVEATGDVVLRLVPLDNSGLPTEEILAETATPLNAPEDEIVELEFVFTDPFSVKAGTDYALVLARLGGGEFVWRADLGNPCGGSIAVRRFADEPFEPFAEGADLLFTTFVKS